MYEFNINDYIWYIVGGIALFFILVGFIADKSGLAKKTFSKDSTSKKKIMPEQPEQKNDVSMFNGNTSESFIDTFSSEMPVVVPEINDESNISINDVPTEDNNAIEESALTEKTIPNDEAVSEPVDTFSAEEPIYLNDDEEEAKDNSLFNLENSYQQINEPVMQDEEDSVWNMDPDEVVINDEDSSVAAENAEDDWGIESTDVSDDLVGLEDVELPNLEDINSDTEEDVWKF